MPFLPTWKTAKSEFETATNKKKPTEKFLGVFRKGTGIESSLKSLDGAKKGAEIKKALAEFKTGYTSYIKLLTDTANDPKNVKPEDKNDYVKAIGKLKTVLTKIEQDAQRVADEASDMGGKEKGTADAKLQASYLKEAEAHIALREQVAKDAAALAVKLKTAGQDLTSRLALVDKQLTAAKQAGATSNTMMHQVAVGVMDRHIDEAEEIVAKQEASVREFTKDGSPMMKARLDNSTTFDWFPEPQKSQLKARRDKVWGPVTQQAAEQNTLIAAMHGVVDKMKAAKATAEASGNQMKSPQEYLTGLQKIKADMENVFKGITIKSDRVVKGRDAFDGKVTGYKGDKASIEKECKLQEDQWNRYGPEIVVARDRIVSMKTQASKLPKGALENSNVAQTTAALQKYADDSVATLAAHYRAGQELQVKINTARAKIK